MSETANVRLVRCPKCENLLPEVTDYSVYQCGGCGAVLKAKNKGVDLDTFSEKSDEERIEGSESNVRSTISSSSLAERRRMTLHNRGESRRTRMTSKDEKKWDVVEADIIQHKRSDKLQRAKVAQDFEDSEIYHENDNGLMRYRKEAPSEPVSKFGYDYENPAYGFSNTDYVGDDRAELLKKLDELKDHLSRSGNLVDKGKEKVPLDRRMSHQDHYASEINRVSMQNPYHDPLNNRPHYPNQYADPPPLMHSRQEMGSDGFYPPGYAPRYRRGPHQAPMPYHITTSHVYKSGPYMDDDGMMYMDAMEPYPPNISRHHPSCSCYQCRTPIPPVSYNDKYSDVPNDRIFNYHDNPSSRDYNHRFSDPRPLKSQLHARWPSVVNSEADGFTHQHPPRVHLPSGGKMYRPIAGGAPFFTCYNCFELLLLPKKVRTNDDDKKKKMSCGACSTVIVLTVSNNNLVVSSDVEPKDNNYIKVDKPKNGHGHQNQVKTTFSADDYDNSGYDIKNRHSTSTYTSEAEEDNESSVSKDDKGPWPRVGSSLQDHFEYSNKYRMANRFGEGNKSGRSEKEKVISDKNGNKQISRNESLETEIDLSSNEYSNTGTTFDSGEGSREGGCLKGNSAVKSFFGGIGFNDSNRSDGSFEQEKANVTVNGHLIPARLIKKAEKLAGPIQPGNYWYDFRAGFWGAIGGPCLGIIPPFIEELNYPMPEHCAGGNTHVFVNGRELNQKDLKLLVSRGLPTERDRSYIVEISGRVLDEDTGEELESLGKLAPTVERMMHGFGMRAPKAVA